jgi:DegV family protein with EDD domain
MIKIITDSTCDIDAKLLEQYDIAVVPCYIIWENEQHLDRVTITPQEFYDRIESDPQHPTTSQPTVEDFYRVYEKAIEKGATEIVCITISSAMSGTFDMASTAAKMVSVPVHMVDSKGNTMMLGWQVIAAARAVAAGKSVEEVLQAVEAVHQRVVLYVGLETISYLARGGRMGDAINWLSNTLSIKPLIAVSRESGKVTPVSLYRTHKAMVEGLYKKFTNALGQQAGKLHIAVMHGNALEEAEKLAARLREEFKPVELFINITGPVLGLHTGPGAIALCGYAEA